MKNTKLDKLFQEQQKVREKIAALQERDKELDRLIRDAEDISIVGLVRSEGYTLESLSALIGKLRDNPLLEHANVPDLPTGEPRTDLPGEEEPTP